MVKYELLMPAGDMEKLKYAFAYGADAVYAGIPAYSLRAVRNGFNIKTIKEAIEYTHNLGKKIYLTVNINPHNHKLENFKEIMGELVDMKPDAFIMADAGLIHLTKKYFPQAEIHLSVQANNVNWAQTEFWYDQGVTRIVLSRELTLKEVKEIHERVPNMEIEFFIHGSICIAYSGRCLISNYTNYRDPNQGTCTNSCRWEYTLNKKAPQIPLQEHSDHISEGEYAVEEKMRPGEYYPVDEDENGTYMFNSRDLCALEYVKDLMDAGVVSYKVEGRSKSIYYVANIARVYRNCFDTLIAGKEPDYDTLLKELAAVANRGFIPGFLAGNLKSQAQKYDSNIQIQTHLFAGAVRSYDKDTQIVEFEVRNQLHKGQEIEFFSPDMSKDFKINLEDFWYIDEPETMLSKVGPGHKNICFKLSTTVDEWTLARIKADKGHTC